MVQKRMTTWDSGQPIASKWWWIGAILKTFLPLRRRFEVSWIITEIVSITKMNAMKGSTITELVSIAMTPIVAPRARAPVSPI